MGLLNRYFLYLSRNDTAQVSYFPGQELSTRSDTDWLEEFLIPAISRIANRRAKNITSVPIGFWVLIRETARIETGEIFVFSTPWRAGKQIEETIRQALASLPHGNVFQGAELLPEKALPYCQIFRGRILRFVDCYEETDVFAVPAILWRSGQPSLAFKPVPATQFGNKSEEEATQVYVRAEINSAMTGDYYRIWQQALKHLAMLEKSA